MVLNNLFNLLHIEDKKLREIILKQLVIDTF